MSWYYCLLYRYASNQISKWIAKAEKWAAKAGKDCV